MKNNSMSEIYESHHESGERYGSSILEKTRGELLRKYVGVNKKVLDIGCRDGVLTKEFAKNNKVLGIDIDSVALQEAKKRLGIETKQADLNGSWDIPSSSFDVVVAGEVLEHLYFPKVVAKKAKNSLKEGGLFVGSVPNVFNLKNRIRLFLGQKNKTPLSDPTHINHFSRKELLVELEKQFDEVQIIPLGRFAWLDSLWPGMFSFGLFFVAKKSS